jgi:hypothetical protein
LECLAKTYRWGQVGKPPPETEPLAPDLQTNKWHSNSTQLKESKGWIRGLGENAELIVPTFGVIAHGIPTNSINMKDQKATIQQMLADNYTVIPNAKISYIGWLTKEVRSQTSILDRR